MVQSWLPHEASLRRDWAPNGVVTLAEREGGPESCTYQNLGCYAEVKVKTWDLMAHLRFVWVTVQASLWFEPFVM